MVLLSIGILIASLFFVAFKIPPKRWRQYLASWLASPTSRVEVVRAAADDQGQEHDKAHQAGVPTVTLEPSTTPKATPQTSSSQRPVPQITLDGDGKHVPPAQRAPASQLLGISSITPSLTLASPSPPSAPRLGSTSPTMQPRSPSPVRAPPSMAPPPPKPRSTMAPPLKPATSNSPSSLMPPPGVRPSALRPLPATSSTLNPPPSAASLARGPPSLRFPPTASLAASSSTLPPAKRPSRKVQLEPGHSPLDWASLTKDPSKSQILRGADLPSNLIRVPPSQLKAHNGRRGTDAWGTYQQRVYNLGPYLKYHPGGVGELMRGAGKVGEAERLFNEIHPWVNWNGMLGECMVGILVAEGEDVGAKDDGRMDEMD